MSLVLLPLASPAYICLGHQRTQGLNGLSTAEELAKRGQGWLLTRTDGSVSVWLHEYTFNSL